VQNGKQKQKHGLSSVLRIPHKHLVILHALDIVAVHRRFDIGQELFPVSAHLLSSILIQRIICVWLQEQILKSDHDRIKVENWFPVLAENIQADITLQVNVWVVDLRTRDISYTYKCSKRVV